MLRASYPDEASQNTWICHSRDVGEANPATIDAYVIGIRPRNSSWPMPTMMITKAVSAVSDKPAVPVAGLDKSTGYIVTGGGVCGVSGNVICEVSSGRFRQVMVADGPDQPALFLTASYPSAGGTNGVNPTGWLGSGKFHLIPGTSTVTTYAINVKFPTPPAPTNTGGTGTGGTGGGSGTPTNCACTLTGGFVPPGFNNVTGGGPTGNLTLAGVGTVRIETSSISGMPQLDIYDSKNHPLLSQSGASAWGASPDGRYFLVAYPSQSINTAAPVQVFRVASTKWPIQINTSAYPDGRWGFAPSPSWMFTLTRFQNGPTPFTAQAFKLGGSSSSMQNVGPSPYTGAGIWSSPCGDLLMYFNWTQLSPQAGEATFYQRSKFPTSPLARAVFDGTASYPSASIVAGGSTGFLVQLSGLKVSGSSATSFASPQCSP
jgi:hypothetical protein